MTLFVRRLLAVLVAFIPITASAALQDWYGVWRYSMAPMVDPSSPVTCTVTISEATATQANASATCTEPDGHVFALPGQMAVVTTRPGDGGQITFGLSITDAGFAWTATLAANDGRTGQCQGTNNGAVQGDSASGSWSASCSASDGTYAADLGSWSMSRISGLAPLPPPPPAQTAYAAPAGKISDATVEVDTSGTYGSASVSVKLDIAKVLLDAPLVASPSGFAAGPTYNVYVLALVPGALLGSPQSVWFMKTQAPSWESLASPIAAFLQNAEQAADQSNRVVIDIVSNTDLTGLIGTEIYVGYGISDTEMLTAGRYRGVYKVQ